MKAPKITDTERQWMDRVNNDRPTIYGLMDSPFIMRVELEEFYEKHFTVIPDGVSLDRFNREMDRSRNLFKRECRELLDEVHHKFQDPFLYAVGMVQLSKKGK